MSDPMLELIPGNPNARARNVNRQPNLTRHLEQVKKEFIGKPYVCFCLIQEIVYIRRNIDISEHIEKFNALLDQYTDTLLRELDIRWLLSICDTYVDIGTEVQSAAAMCVVIEINYLNIQATILDAAKYSKVDTQSIAQYRGKRPTWGGMITCDIRAGDMMYNMANRVNKIVAKDPMVNKIWNEIKDRLRDDLSIPVNMLASVNKDKEKRKFFI